MVKAGLSRNVCVIAVVLSMVSLHCPKPIVPSRESGNPFSPVTTFEYDLTRPQNVVLITYNVLGQTLDTLVHQVQEQGHQTIIPDLACYDSGVYFYQLQTEDTSYIKKFILVR